MDTITLNRETFCTLVSGLYQKEIRDILWRYVRFNEEFSTTILQRAADILFDRLVRGEIDLLPNPKHVIEQAVYGEVMNHLLGQTSEP